MTLPELVHTPPTPAKHGARRHAEDLAFHLRNAELAAERLEHRIQTIRGRDGARRMRAAARRLRQFANELTEEASR